MGRTHNGAQQKPSAIEKKLTYYRQDMSRKVFLTVMETWFSMAQNVNSSRKDKALPEVDFDVHRDGSRPPRHFCHHLSGGHGGDGGGGGLIEDYVETFWVCRILEYK